MPGTAAEPWWRPFRTVCHAAVLRVDLMPDAARDAEASRWLDEQGQRLEDLGYERFAAAIVCELDPDSR